MCGDTDARLLSLGGGSGRGGCDCGVAVVAVTPAMRMLPGAATKIAAGEEQRSVHKGLHYRKQPPLPGVPGRRGVRYRVLVILVLAAKWPRPVIT